MVALRHLVVLALATVTLAFPTPTIDSSHLSKRTISGATAGKCGKNSFSPTQVEAAASAAASRVAQGEQGQVGKNKYPHKFNNREGFQFARDCKAPFYEFPIFQNKVYTGESPGPDRVVIGSVRGADAAYCGLITHTGAGGNKFLQCDPA
ncbi:Guanyl-specific ribonuclease F1 OS=Gibberella fujikuroi PE=1 SV=4 [Rhizoctonia solani AG-1 IB]|uniref:Guanyl-specific ribonuclease F1 n=2 Tax=Thanatephorus cucumeris (strain AG1-IB / isolate 7/3/14) TaxID=1108050 RepID=A0A0B7FES8_THACB|nr:Guanyl-specific ribonuclease F1 OS=Gibberella fujikuroi PE=1 SV=4 [Rhizoctonia solani AG-1 IB]